MIELIDHFTSLVFATRIALSLIAMEAKAKKQSSVRDRSDI
jgi:hypothetical protein